MLIESRKGKAIVWQKPNGDAGYYRDGNKRESVHCESLADAEARAREYVEAVDAEWACTYPRRIEEWEHLCEDWSGSFLEVGGCTEHGYYALIAIADELEHERENVDGKYYWQAHHWEFMDGIDFGYHNCPYGAIAAARAACNFILNLPLDGDTETETQPQPTQETLI